MPSDLLGIHMPRFSSGDEHELIASVNGALGDARKSLEALGIRPLRMKLVGSWGFDRAACTFTMRLPAVLLRQNRELLAGKRLVLAARIRDENINPEDDRRLAVGPPRRPSEIDGDLTLHVSNRRRFRKATVGNVIEGFLLLVPEGLNPKRCGTISDMKAQGAELVEAKGRTVAD
jgi:hypothetical protein